ncbi:hypothetical protein, partial [Campylobacter sputorum]|uniref:hypothetical protein n=1 Tax=Campylobacter sputorum TaxID=206 RepID=UPI00053BE38C
MNGNEKEIIQATKEFIASSGYWTSNEFMVFFTIAFLVVVLFIFFISRKDSGKMSDKLIELSKEQNEALKNNTNAVNQYAEVTKELLSQNLTKQEALNQKAQINESKLDEIRFGVREIKEMIR